MAKLLVIGKFDASDSARPVVASFVGLKDLGYEIKVMCSRMGWATDYLKDHGIEVIDHHPKKKVDKASIRFVRQFLSQFQPDILYLLNSKSIPNGIQAAKNHPVKVVTYRGALKLYWFDPFAYLGHLHPRVDRIICLTEAIAKDVSRQTPYMRKKPHVIAHGYDPAWYQRGDIADATEFTIPKDSFIICCVANNRPVKGIKYLIQAMKYLEDYPDIHLLLLGRDMDKQVLEESKNLNHPERIKSPGFISNPRAVFNIMDVYVQPSIHEGFGKSIAEVMCFGKPIIATRSGGPEALIEDQKSGLLVPTKNAKAIANAILSIYNDRHLGYRLGEGASDRLRNQFGIAESIRKHDDFFRSLTED